MSYAVITGASKGIGKAMAEELATKGYSLLLVARSADLLQELSSRLAGRYGVKADCLAVDLSATDAAEKVYQHCRNNQYPVTVLVNNAGYGLSGSFEKYSLADELNMMQVNMSALVQMTRLFLPVLRDQPKAYILNIASTAAYQAVPYMSLYAGTKAFVLTFSRGLRWELRKSGVSVTCVSPGATDTEFTVRAKIGEKGLKTAAKVNMTPEAVAKMAIDGMLAGKAEIIPGLVNKLGAFLVWLMPKGLVEKTAMKIYE
ncbi:MAG TPA: SDR family oxidoreductase [Puia sp.]|nr:SDR family oxidoreductase [Puia sp.]